MSYAFIDARKAEHPVSRMCRVLSVSQSGYYAWKRRPQSRRRRDDKVLSARMRMAFLLSHSTYGSPRMVHELRDQGFAVGRRRVARLMRETGLRARQKRPRGHRDAGTGGLAVAGNLIARQFAADGPNRKWAADITHLWTGQGWLYLAVILDLYARRDVRRERRCPALPRPRPRCGACDKPAGPQQDGAAAAHRPLHGVIPHKARPRPGMTQGGAGARPDAEPDGMSDPRHR